MSLCQYIISRAVECEGTTSKEMMLKNILLLAPDGFDPSTSGLWAQHASAAPRCSGLFSAHGHL